MATLTCRRPNLIEIHRNYLAGKRVRSNQGARLDPICGMDFISEQSAKFETRDREFIVFERSLSDDSVEIDDPFEDFLKDVAPGKVFDFWKDASCKAVKCMLICAKENGLDLCDVKSGDDFFVPKSSYNREEITLRSTGKVYDLKMRYWWEYIDKGKMVYANGKQVIFLEKNNTEAKGINETGEKIKLVIHDVFRGNYTFKHPKKEQTYWNFSKLEKLDYSKKILVKKLFLKRTMDQFWELFIALIFKTTWWKSLVRMFLDSL